MKSLFKVRVRSASPILILELKNTKLFKHVAVNADTNTIEWPNGADFAPEFLYKIGKKVKKATKIDI